MEDAVRKFWLLVTLAFPPGVRLLLFVELLRLVSSGLRINVLTGVDTGVLIALVGPTAIVIDAVEDAEEAMTLCGNGSQTRISIMSPAARPG